MVGLGSGQWPVPSLSSVKDASLLLQGKVYDACIRSCMLHRSQTWSLTRENELALELGIGVTEAVTVTLRTEYELYISGDSSYRLICI